MWALQAFRSPNEMKKIRTRERKDYLIGHHDKWTQATNESVSFKTTGVTLFKYNYWTRVNKSTQHPLTALWANNWCEVWEAVHSWKSRDVTRQLSLHLLCVWPISGVIRLWSHLTGNSEQHHVMNTPGGILSSNKCCLEIISFRNMFLSPTGAHKIPIFLRPFVHLSGPNFSKALKSISKILGL